MRSRINFESQDNSAEIDMTPMLDIVFIMLIFFIVSTTFVRESGVDINRPTSSTAATKESSGAMLAITAQGDIWLDRKQIDLRMIRPTLERLKVEQPDIGVIIQSDKDAKTGILIKVLDQVKLSGIEKVSVAAKAGAH